MPIINMVYKPKKPRQPAPAPSNAIARRPLTSGTTVNDLIWSYTLTNTNNVTFWDVWWIDCATFSWSNYLGVDMNRNAFSVSLWAYITDASVSSWDRAIIASYTRSGSNYYWSDFVIRSDRWITLYMLAFGVRSMGTPSQIIQNWWTHFVFCNWNWAKIYINWVLQASSEENANLRSPFYIWDNEGSFIWAISSVARRDWEWTATEIADYYAQNKWNYWIS